MPRTSACYVARGPVGRSCVTPADFDSRSGAGRSATRGLIASELRHALDAVEIADLVAVQIDAVLIAASSVLRIGGNEAVDKARRVTCRVRSGWRARRQVRA